MTTQQIAVDAASAPKKLELLLADHTKLGDPYELLAWLRDNSPVSNVKGMYFVTRYEDVARLYLDPVFSRHQQALAEANAHPAGDADDEMMKQAKAVQPFMLINLDEPAHMRVRRILEVAFLPKHVAAWKPRVEAIANRLIDQVLEQEQFDLKARLAYPLPEMVICDLMGVPHADHALWGAWTEAVVAAARTHTPSPETVHAVNEAVKNFYLYCRDLVIARRKNLGDDLVSLLIRAESDGDRLNELELSGTLQMLIQAGHETTANLIGNGMYCLLKHPDQYDQLRADPSMTPSAVEEMLRYFSPAHWALPRTATADVRLGNVTIPKGCPVFGALNSANRDATMFSDPERFDITRTANKHMAFATGPHLCLGRLLARQEANAIFRGIVTRLPKLELVKEPKLKLSFVRALEDLHVRRST